MSSTRIVVAAALALAVASPPVLAQRTTLGLECSFSDECPEPLVCAGGYCRAQCRTDRDCSAGWVCRPVRYLLPDEPLPPGVVISRDGAGQGEPGTGFPAAQLAAGAQPQAAHKRCVPPGRENLATWRWGRLVFLPIEPCPCAASAATAAVGVPVGAGETPPPSTSRATLAVSGAAFASGYEFKRGDDDALWLRPAGGEWQAFGGVLTSEPAAVAVGKDRSMVFARGSDDAVWGVECKAGACAEWFSLGAAAVAGPSASLDANGDVTVTLQTKGGLAYVNVLREGTWSGWMPAK